MVEDINHGHWGFSVCWVMDEVDTQQHAMYNYCLNIIFPTLTWFSMAVILYKPFCSGKGGAASVLHTIVVGVIISGGHKPLCHTVIRTYYL